MLAACGDDGPAVDDDSSSSDGGTMPSTSTTTSPSTSATTTASTTESSTASTTDPDTSTGADTSSESAGTEESSTTEPPLQLDDYATYFGGVAQDSARDLAVDDEGFIYVTGGTASGGFATTDGSTFQGVHDVWITKLDPDGAVVWSTLVGGNNYDRAYALELGPDGDVYVAGRAGPGFPTTAGVVQESFGGDVNPSQAYGSQDGFVVRLAGADGAIVWSTYFGGDDQDFIRDIAVDADGEVYLVSITGRTNPHVDVDAWQPMRAGGLDSVVGVLDADGSAMQWCTYVGGSADEAGEGSVRVDSQQRLVYLSGTSSDDAPVTPGAHQDVLQGPGDHLLVVLEADGSDAAFATYFGGSGGEGVETHNLAVGDDDSIFIGAMSNSMDVEVTPGAFQTAHAGNGGPGTGQGTNYPSDGLVAKFDPSGTLVAATFLGGSVGEAIEGIAIAPNGDVHVTGATFSDDFPLTNDAAQSQRAGDADAFLAVLSSDLDALVYSTYWGGSDWDYGRATAVDSVGSMYTVGYIASTDFPVTADAAFPNAGGGDDAMLVRVVP